MTSLLVTCVCSCSFVAVGWSPTVSARDPRVARCSSYVAPITDTVAVPLTLYASALLAGGKGTGNTQGLIVFFAVPTVYLTSAIYGYVVNGVCCRRARARATQAPPDPNAAPGLTSPEP
jgi:hypothetical protein